MKQTLNLRTRDSNDPATIFFFFPVQCILGKKKHVTIVEGEIAKFLRFFLSIHIFSDHVPDTFFPFPLYIYSLFFLFSVCERMVN